MPAGLQSSKAMLHLSNRKITYEEYELLKTPTVAKL